MNNSLALGDPAIILEIQHALLQGSKGMFLWVVLQIQSLCAMQTDHDIRDALANLPQDLSEIYNGILQQAKRPGRSLRSDIFKLIMTTRRPLTADEIRVVLSVTPGNTTWDHSKLVNSIYPALATCGLSHHCRRRGPYNTYCASECEPVLAPRRRYSSNQGPRDSFHNGRLTNTDIINYRHLPQLQYLWDGTCYSPPGTRRRISTLPYHQSCG
jgi:hypothetical protein